MDEIPNRCWLIGVPKSGLDANRDAMFKRHLKTRFQSYQQPESDGQETIIRAVTDPVQARALQARYGGGFTAFYYVDEAFMNAARITGSKLYPLQVVFSEPEGAEVKATIRLPQHLFASGPVSEIADC